MRNVSFVERIELEFSGTLFNQALVIGDIDNDKANELAVGSINGDLAIFKRTNAAPWKKFTDLGMITCVGIGNILNTGKNNLVCLTAEGLFYVFDIKSDSANNLRDPEVDDQDKQLKPCFTQHLPANGKVMLTADVDGDGETELVIAYSDRIVRLFRWQEHADGDPDSPGTLAYIEKWQLAGQIGSITVNKSADGTPTLMVAQPGGTFVTLHTGSAMQAEAAESSTDDHTGPTLVYHPLGSHHARNTSVSTEIVGCIRRGKEQDSGKPTLYALATLDGTLMLVEDDAILWSLQVDHQLFSLTKLDVTGDSTEEVVCCSWDGQTYIVNHSREVVRYQFEENVAAFAAGFYAVSGKENTPCLVYATFNNKIYIYYNIRLPEVKSTSLIEVMDSMEETHHLLNKLDITSSNLIQLRQLYHWCLYGSHAKS